MDYYNPYFKMGYCSVPFCDHNSNTYKGFSVPFKNPVRMQEWTNACPFLLNYSHNEIKFARICRKHFIPRHVIDNNKLTPDAVPLLHIPPFKKLSGDSKPLLNKPFKEQQLTGKAQHSSNLNVRKNNLTSDVVPSSHLKLPLKGLSRDSKLEINKSSSEEQQLTGNAQHSSNIKVKNQDKKLVIEPSINVAEFSLNPSSFIYVPSGPKNSNESVGIDTDLVNLSSDGDQESISKQERPQISSAQIYNIIQKPQLDNLDKQYLTTYNSCSQNFPMIQPIAMLNNVNKLKNKMLPETTLLEEQNSSIVQKDVETRHFNEHDSEDKEESYDNINKFISRLEYICYTCLSEDRKLTKLADVNDGINNLLYLVSCNGKVYEELSNYVDEVYICWECKALMNRFRRFRNQVCNAQQQLKNINDNKYKNLSNLSTTHYQNFYNYQYFIVEDSANVTDNLKSGEDLICEELNALPNIKQNGKNSIGYIVDDNVHYLTIQMSAFELSEDMRLRKADQNFIAATHKCTKCIKTFNDEEELNQHVSDYHKLPQHVKCYICESYVRSDWHQEHNDSHFVKYKCHRCYKYFYSTLEMLEHLYETHNVKDTFEEIIRKKLQTMKELRVKPLVLYSPSGRTFCYICSRCNQCYVSQTEINMRCEPCQKILETIEPKCGNDLKCHVVGENKATGKKMSQEKIIIEQSKNMSNLQTPNEKHRTLCTCRNTSSGDKLLCTKLDKKSFKDTTKHIIYDHGYAKTPESNHNKAKADNNRSLLKLDSSNTCTGQINLKKISDDAHRNIEYNEEECPDIVKSISGQNDIETVEISDIENAQNASYVMYNLSEFLKIPASRFNYEITKQETNVTEQTTEGTKEKTDITEITTEITESKTKVTEESFEEDFVLDPNNPTYKIISKYDAHYITEQTTEGTKEKTDITEITTEITESETKVTEERFEEDFVLDPNNPTYKIISKYDAHYTVNKMTVTEMQDSLEQRKLVPKFAEAMYKCEFCIEIFNDHQERHSHTIQVHVKPTSIISHRLCDICSVYIKDRCFKEHRNNHFLVFFCHYCDFMAYNVLVIWKHLRIEHTCKVYSDKEEQWMKRRIKYTNPGTCHLNVDIKANQKSSVGYICLECNELFPTLALKTKHNRLYHRTPKIKCSKCTKTFRRVSKLKEHELKHKLPPVFKTCSVCKKQVANMRLHMRIHRGPAMSCADCKTVYSNRTAYLQHLRYTAVHSGDKFYKYKCSFCDKRFNRKATRRDHINYIHKGVAYECGVCHKMLSSAAQMWAHMYYIHRRSFKQYLCPTCGIVCKNIKVLKDHELYHSGGHVTCHLCGRQYRKYSSLNNHRYIAHKSSIRKDAVVVETIEQ